MKLEKNGRQSSGQRTRHVNIRYFFIKDKIEQNEIQLEYCPTNNMIADFFTKPLQGQHFKRLRDVVMGAKHYSTLNHSKEKIQERVGKDEVIKNVDKQVRFSSDINEDKRRNGDPTGVDVNKFSTKYRKSIEGTTWQKHRTEY